MNMKYSLKLETTIEAIKAFYLREETEFDNFKKGTSFVWDHCFRVACLAVWLAQHPISLPVHTNLSKEMVFLAGLLHDAGKFKVRSLFETRIPEETFSAQVTKLILEQNQWDKDTIGNICSAFQELYRDKTHLPLAQLIRDADTLSKLGPQGLLSFVSKWTLRELPPCEMLLKKLTIELTYTINAANAMITPQGKKEAFSEVEWTMTYFSNLIAQWKEQGILDLEKQIVNLNNFKIVHVRSTKHPCKHPSRKWNYRFGKGIKCTKILIESMCSSCNTSETNDFCIPLLYNK
ncbi:MAG: HD domain-containing protein [Candidatus Hodarchaeales archaeon]|jgi:hypothetical protein